MDKFLKSALAAISVVKVAELIQWLPEPESFVKAAILALATGFLGGMGRWLSDIVKRKFKRQ